MNTKTDPQRKQQQQQQNYRAGDYTVLLFLAGRVWQNITFFP